MQAPSRGGGCLAQKASKDLPTHDLLQISKTQGTHNKHNKIQREPHGGAAPSK